MKAFASFFFAALASSSIAFAQQPPPAVHSLLLDHLAGRWVMQYAMRGTNSIHDVTAMWVLGHHYLELREISREKTSAGEPDYQADIFITLDAAPKAYVVEWLDDFGGAVAPMLGYAAPQANRMRFIFRGDSGGINFINDMRYDSSRNEWTWTLDNIEHGKVVPFARASLRRSGTF